MKFLFFPIFLFLLLFDSITAEKRIEVGIDEQLGKVILFEGNFKDENGNDVDIRTLFSKPTVLTFVYYNCPGICSPLLMEVSDVVNKSDLIIGVDYNLVSISMDEFETYKDAFNRKQIFLSTIDKNIPPESWKFLTGDSASIKNLADQSGFFFKRNGKDFLHAGALIFIDKNGKICRYLFPGYSNKSGFGILPFDFKMAILETSEGKVTPTISKILQFCFSYDPEGQTYVLNFTRIFGGGILLFVAVLLIYIRFKPKKEIIKR